MNSSPSPHFKRGIYICQDTAQMYFIHPKQPLKDVGTSVLTETTRSLCTHSVIHILMGLEFLEE